jgi:hypothetical protein
MFLHCVAKKQKFYDVWQKDSPDIDIKRLIFGLYIFSQVSKLNIATTATATVFTKIITLINI